MDGVPRAFPSYQNQHKPAVKRQCVGCRMSVELSRHAKVALSPGLLSHENSNETENDGKTRVAYLWKNVTDAI